MAHDVFLSYSSKDKAVADAATAALEASGIRCWIAPRDILPGQQWGEAIIDAIAGSRFVVLIFSAHSNDSPQVQREVERAVNKGVHIIPFRIQRTELSKQMEYFISTPHWLDAMSGPLRQHLQTLAETIHKLLPAASLNVPLASPTDPTSPARRGTRPGEARRQRRWPRGALRWWLLGAAAVALVLTLGLAGIAWRGWTRGKQPVPLAIDAQPAATGHPHRVVNLLPLIRLPNDAFAGTWNQTGSELVCSSAKPAKAELALPYVPPAEYDFHIEFTHGGDGHVVQILTHGDRTFDWLMGRNGKISGFEQVNGKSAEFNGTLCSLDLTRRVRRSAVVRVRQDSVAAYLEGTLVSSHKTDSAFSDMTLYTGWEKTAGRLGIGLYNGDVTFHVVEVTEITGKGQTVR